MIDSFVTKKYTYDLSKIALRSSTALTKASILLDLWSKNGLPLGVKNENVRLALCENNLEVSLINSIDDKVVVEGGKLELCYYTPDRMHEGTFKQLLNMVSNSTINSDYHIEWIMRLGNHLYGKGEFPTD